MFITRSAFMLRESTMDVSKLKVPAVVEEVGKKTGFASFFLDGQIRQARFHHQRTVELCGGDIADLLSCLQPGLEVTLLNLEPMKCHTELQKGITFQADCKLIDDIPNKKGKNLKSSLSLSGLSTLTSKNKSETSRPSSDYSSVGTVHTVIKHEAGKVPRTVIAAINNKLHFVFIHFYDTKVNGVTLAKFKTTELLQWKGGMQVEVKNLRPYSANGCTYEGAIDIDVTHIPKNESNRPKAPLYSQRHLDSLQSSLALPASSVLPSQNTSDSPLPSTNFYVLGTVTSVRTHGKGAVPRTVKITINNTRHNVFIHKSETKVNGAVLEKFKFTEKLKWEVGMQVGVKNLKPYSEYGCTYKGAINIDIIHFLKNFPAKVKAIEREHSLSSIKSPLILPGSSGLPSLNMSETSHTTNNQYIVGTVTSVIKHEAGKVPCIVEATIKNKQHNVFVHKSDIRVNGFKLKNFESTELLNLEVGMPVDITNLKPYSANGCTYEAAINIVPIRNQPLIQNCMPQNSFKSNTNEIVTVRDTEESLAPKSDGGEFISIDRFDRSSSSANLVQMDPKTDNETNNVVCSNVYGNIVQDKEPSLVSFVLNDNREIAMFLRTRITVNGKKMSNKDSLRLPIFVGMPVLISILLPYTGKQDFKYFALIDVDESTLPKLTADDELNYVIPPQRSLPSTHTFVEDKTLLSDVDVGHNKCNAIKKDDSANFLQSLVNTGALKHSGRKDTIEKGCDNRTGIGSDDKTHSEDVNIVQSRQFQVEGITLDTEMESANVIGNTRAPLSERRAQLPSTAFTEIIAATIKSLELKKILLRRRASLDLERATASTSQDFEAPQATVPEVSPQVTVPEVSPQATIPEVSPQATLLKVSPQVTLPKVSSQATVPEVSSQATIPKVSPQATLPEVSSQATIPKVSPQATIPIVPPQATIPIVPPQATIPIVSPQATIPKVSPQAILPRAKVMCSQGTQTISTGHIITYEMYPGI